MMNVHIYICIYVYVYLYIYLSIHPSIDLSIYLSIYVCIYVFFPGLPVCSGRSLGTAQSPGPYAPAPVDHSQGKWSGALICEGSDSSNLKTPFGGDIGPYVKVFKSLASDQGPSVGSTPRVSQS